MVAATVLLGVVGTRSLSLFTMALALVGFTLFGPDSLLSGVGAIDVGSRRRAVLAAGIINGIGSLGPPLQEQLIGYLKTRHGLGAVFLLLGVVALLGTLVTGLLWHAGRRGRSRF
jgi:sugar phosphate permease